MTIVVTEINKYAVQRQTIKPDKKWKETTSGKI
jgi:hypothetical protein